MKNRIVFKSIGIIAITLFSISALFANPNPTPVKNSWDHLGTKKIRSNDKDVIYVSNDGEWYSSIELRAKSDQVDLQRVVVHYFDGSQQDVTLGQDNLTDEYQTINLTGGNSNIDKIEIYGSKTQKKKATVEVWGKVGGKNTTFRSDNNIDYYSPLNRRYLYGRRYGYRGGFGLGFNRGFGFRSRLGFRRGYYRY